MKRAFAMFGAAAISAGLFSCAHKVPEPFDVSKEGARAVVVNENTSDFEGFYTNGEYMIEMNCMDKKNGTAVHNIVIFTSDDGSQVFFAALEGDLSAGISAECECSEGDSMEVSVKAENAFDVLSVELMCNGSRVSSASGEYSYCGESWSCAEKKDRVFICEGVYRNGPYKLSVSRNGGNMRFVITDDDNGILCESIMAVDEESRSVLIEKDGISVEIAAGITDEELHMEIIECSEELYGFSGIYIKE